MDFQTNEQAGRHTLHQLKEIILANDPKVNEVMAEVLEFTHSFLFEEGGEFVYGLTMTVDTVVFHSPLLGEEAPINPKLSAFIQKNLTDYTLDNGSLHLKVGELHSTEDGMDQHSFYDHFGNFIRLIATLRS